MGERGKARMPQKLRLLTGDTHTARFNEHEPSPMPGELVCPADASDDVRRIWDAGVVELRAMGLAYPSDVHSWRVFCEAVVTHEKACALLAISPLLIKGVMGGLIRNPALAVQRDAGTQVVRLASQFGLTPSARSTVQAHRVDPYDDNPFAG